MKRSASVLVGVIGIIIFAAVLMFHTYPVKTHAADEITVFTDNGDAVSIFGNIEINDPTPGDVVVVFGNININSEVQGDVVSVFGNISVNAKVTGETVSVFGKITLLDKAVIGGDLVAIGSLEKTQGAILKGQEVIINLRVLIVARAILTLILTFFALILGLAIIGMAKDRFRRMTSTIESNFARRLGIGFAAMVGVTIISLPLTITFVAPLLYLVLLLIAEMTASIYFGKQILKVFNLSLNVYLEFITGLLFITLVKVAIIMAVPQYNLVIYAVLYGLFGIFINSLGTGVLIDTKFGSGILQGSTKKVSFGSNSTGIFNEDINFSNPKLDISMGGSEDVKKE